MVADVLLRLTQDALYSCDASSLRIDYANPAYLALLGKKARDVIGHSHAELGYAASVEAEIRGQVARSRATGMTQTWVALIEQPSAPRHFELAASVSGDTVAICMRDVTERVHMVSLARFDLEGLRKERKLRENFVGALTDDLRMPLANAMTVASHLFDAGADLSDAHRGWLKKITRSLERADRMIENLLEITRIRSGHRLPLHLETLDLGLLAQEIVTELNLAHGHRIRLDTQGGLRGVWNREGLRRVLENLLGNALRHGSKDGLITLSLRDLGSDLRLEAHNLGPPISAENLERLFVPYHQIDSAAAGTHRGWGLGLSLTQGIIESHGGTIRALSETGHGTSFVVVLPRDSGPHQTVTKAP
jgi:signal transduction histidine kinase